MKTITPQELQQALQNQQNYTLLDVREAEEVAVCQIKDSMNIPMSEIMQRKEELDSSASIVVICHHGMRSAQVGMFLEQSGFGDITNLQGGIDAWSVQVEPEMPRY